MSAPQQPNPTSLKIRLAHRFLHALNTLNAKRSDFDHTHIHLRSHRVKIAAYSSMASLVGPKRAWSRAILRKIRNPRNRIRLHRITSTRLRLLRRPSTRRSRNPNYKNPKGEHVANSGLEVKLRKLVPGAGTMDSCGLLDETADYIKYLATQVEVMRTLVDFYSTN